MTLYRSVEKRTKYGKDSRKSANKNSVNKGNNNCSKLMNRLRKDKSGLQTKMREAH